MPDPNFVCTVVAGGQRYTNWKSVMVRRDYGDYISYFTLVAAEPGPYGKGWASIQLKPGDPVQIYLGRTKVIDGNVTTRQASYDAKSHDLVIAGKSLTQKLDTSCKVQPGTYNGNTFEQAARGVLSATGVGLVIKNPPAIASKPFKNLSIQHGESVGEFIERLAKFRGFFLTDDENGNLVASQVQPGGPVAELYEGRNILRAVGKLDDQNLWSGLNIHGQQPGDDADYPTRDISASVSSPTATVQREQTIVAEHPGDAQDLQQRANHEAAFSLWPVVECQVTVVGWFMQDGSLWTPTKNVTLYSPSIFPNESGSMPLGIQACIYAQDSENGTTTTLELKLPGALTSLPDPTSLPGSSGGTGNLVDNPKPNAARIDPPDTWSGAA